MDGVTIDELKKSPLYSEELDIVLLSGNEPEVFKWFLASLLFGARISEKIARHTYRIFEKYALLEPKTILKAGRDFLINPIMREGGYVRYDGVASNKVLKNCQALLEEYEGKLTRLHEAARDSRDLERRLSLFPGVGPVTVNIFLRELRPVWRKADPDPLPRVLEVAENYGIELDFQDRKSVDFVRIEAGLIRLRKGKSLKH